MDLFLIERKKVLIMSQKEKNAISDLLQVRLFLRERKTIKRKRQRISFFILKMPKRVFRNKQTETYFFFHRLRNSTKLVDLLSYIRTRGSIWLSEAILQDVVLSLI